jgi:hypothetical protein
MGAVATALCPSEASTVLGQGLSLGDQAEGKPGAGVEIRRVSSPHFATL